MAKEDGLTPEQHKRLEDARRRQRESQERSAAMASISFEKWKGRVLKSDEKKLGRT